MAMPGELTGVENEVIQCSECGADLPLRILHSAAGYHIGRFCNTCGPYSRETSYFKTEKEARKVLDTMNFQNCLRNTEYHGEQS